MSEEIVEKMLERLLAQNEQVIVLLQRIHDELNWLEEHSLAQEIRSRLEPISDIRDELNWLEEFSLGRQIMDRLEQIEASIASSGEL